MKTSKCKVSVVLTTYNGESYILEQIRSIYQQTYQPDEVLIFDDKSSDATVKIIEDFILENNISNWKLCINDVNKGWRVNFYDGFHCATGDIVFCSDQDDIWHKDKIDKMVQLMLQNADMKVLACNLAPFTDDGSQIVNSQYKNIGKKIVEKVPFDIHWYEIKRQGCSMCFRRSILEDIEKIWFKEAEHDLILWVYGILTDGLYVINEKLIDFRRHSGNNSPGNLKNSTTRLGLLHHCKMVVKQIMDNADELSVSSDKLLVVRKYEKFIDYRIEAIETKSVFKLIGLLKYILYYPKVLSFFGDVLSAYRM